MKIAKLKLLKGAAFFLALNLAVVIDICAQDTISFYSNFEDQDLVPDISTIGNNIDLKNGGTIEVVSNPRPDNINRSNYVLKVNVPKSEQGGYARAEYSSQWNKRFDTQGTTHIYQWKVFFPDDYILNIDTIWSGWNIISQFVTDPCAKYPRDAQYEYFSDRICGGGGIFNDVRIDKYDYNRYKFDYRAEPDCHEEYYTYVRGEWIMFTYEIYWTTGDNGYYRLYINSDLLGEASGIRTLPEGFIEDLCDIRWKVGMYSSWWDDDQDTLSYYVDDMELYINRSIDEICPECVGLTTVTPCVDFAVEGTVVSSNFNSDDGSIDLTVSGGQEPYNYLWSDSNTSQDRTGLKPGDYSVVVTDDNNCELEKSFTISEMPDLCADFVLTGTSSASSYGENNGSIDLTASGGLEPYSYLWSDSNTSQDRTDLTPGEYTVIVTDNNSCELTQVFTIEESADPCVGFAVTGTTLASNYGANDGSIDLTVNGGQKPYSYLWSDSYTSEDRIDLTPGEYTVVVTDDNSCEQTQLFTIEENSNPCISFAVSGTVVNCEYNESNGSISLTVTGGVEPYIYTWDDSSEEKDRNNLEIGTYTVNVVDDNGCSDKQSFVVEENPISLEIIRYYPNPTNGLLAIEYISPKDGTVELIIENSQGEVVKINEYSSVKGSNKITEDFSVDNNGNEISKGRYQITIRIDGEEDNVNVVKR